MKWTLEPGQDYIDHCVEIIAAIDPEDLALRELGQLIGQNERLVSGPSTRVHTLGKIATPSGLLEIAFKEVNHPEFRIITELRDITFITSRTPEFLDKFPYFVGSVAIEGADFPIGIITEDASRGGSLRVIERRMRPETFDALMLKCSDVMFDDDTLESHTTFDVGGEERILDLAPSVFGLSVWGMVDDIEEFGTIDRKARDSEEKATVQVDPNSPLAKSVQIK